MSLGRNMNGLNCSSGGPAGCGCTSTRSDEGCGPNVIVWISDFELIEKCTDWPALIVRVDGKNRNHDTLPESLPATTLLPVGLSLPSFLARLTAFLYSLTRARRSALALGIVADFGSTFTCPDMPGCTRQM